jgi:hypothetical protein
MPLTLQYLTAYDRNLDSREPKAKECVIDRLLSSTDLNAAITFSPRLMFISSVFLANYKDESRRVRNREVFICYLEARHTTLRRKPTPREIDLWCTLTRNQQDRIASIFNKIVSTALPQDLSSTDIRFDWLGDEIYLKLSMPIGPTLTCGRFERMCSKLDGSLKAAWLEVERSQALAKGPADPGKADRVLGEPETHSSVFISYGGPDKHIAHAINDYLVAHGVKTWFFPDNALPGQKLHRVMSEGVAKHERVLLICSESSLSRTGVQNELERVLEREAREGGSEILIPVSIDKYVFSEWAPERRDLVDQVRSRVIAQFPASADRTDEFNIAAAKLLKALRK